MPGAETTQTSCSVGRTFITRKAQGGWGNSESFEHAPLAFGEIQLLRFHRIYGEDDICCELQRFSSSASPKYTALSYTWDDVFPAWIIMLNGKKLSVTWSLWYFLAGAQRRQHHGTWAGGWLWISKFHISLLLECTVEADCVTETQSVLIRITFLNAISLSST